jgi:peroxiredoxin
MYSSAPGHAPNLIQDFRLHNHENAPQRLQHLMGEKGVLLVLTSDIWNMSSIRYVLWLQNSSYKLALNGIECAVIVPAQPYEISGFYMSIPRTIPFPLLADPNREVYDYFGGKEGFVLVGRDREVRKQWTPSDRSTPRIRDILRVAGA